MNFCKCGKPISVKSTRCKSCSNRERTISDETREKHRNKVFSLETRERMSLPKTGKRNPMWKGNKVGYSALHQWVKKYFKKPEKCQCCKKVPSVDLANKGIYNRDLENWEYLCRKCHMIKDGRINNLLVKKNNRL